MKNLKKFFTFTYNENTGPEDLRLYIVQHMENIKSENIKEQSFKDLEFYDAFLFYYSKLHLKKANF